MKYLIFVSRKYYVGLFALTFWIIALFPGRIGSDSLTLVNAMRNGSSSDQWTAVYFRVLQLFTFNGNLLWPAGLLFLVILVGSVLFFLESLPQKDTFRKTVFSILSISPFIGNWGMTVNHETLDLAALFLLSAILIRKFHSISFRESPVIILSGILSLTSFVGSLAFLGFLFIYFFSKKILLLTFAIAFSVLTIFASAVLAVQPMNSAWKYITFLGDIKCIVQHPKADITSAESRYLDSIGSQELWALPQTCLVADFGVGALDKPEIDNPGELLKTWTGLVSRNPQIALEARIQRSATILPPIFFKPQPNMISENYLDPVGKGTNTDLQQFSEIFKTSIDDAKFEDEKLLEKNPFEYIALLMTFIINQRSEFWGYGSLWLLAWVLISPFLLKMSFRKSLLVTFPVFTLSTSLLFLMPSPQPRYTGIHILLGLIATIFLFLEGQKKYQRRLSSSVAK